MNGVLAYVIAVLHPLLLNSGDVRSRLGPLNILANEITALPYVPRDAFKNSYYRIENKGIFISKNLRDYIYYGEGDSDDEGVVITLNFESAKQKNPPNDLSPVAYLLHSKNISEKDKTEVDEFIKNMQIAEENTGTSVEFEAIDNNV